MKVRCKGSGSPNLRPYCNRNLVIRPLSYRQKKPIRLPLFQYGLYPRGIPTPLHQLKDYINSYRPLLRHHANHPLPMLFGRSNNLVIEKNRTRTQNECDSINVDIRLDPKLAPNAEDKIVERCSGPNGDWAANSALAGPHAGGHKRKGWADCGARSHVCDGGYRRWYDSDKGGTGARGTAGQRTRGWSRVGGV